MALQFELNLDGLPGLGNWIQFFENSFDLAGKIENNNNGNVQYESDGSDYAEMLERLHPEEQIKDGDVVGVFGGRISKRTDGAEWVMAITGNAVVVGNAIYNGTEDLHEIVSFVGQVPVGVRGAVAIGDYIVASGMNDGTAIAVSPHPKTMSATEATDIVFGYGESENLTETMRITGTGNVGIGTTTPTSALDVGGGNISLNGGWLSGDGGNQGVFVRNDGNVGVGTGSPSPATSASVTVIRMPS